MRAHFTHPCQVSTAPMSEKIPNCKAKPTAASPRLITQLTMSFGVEPSILKSLLTASVMNTTPETKATKVAKRFINISITVFFKG